jgi:hypothetical protein
MMQKILFAETFDFDDGITHFKMKDET